MTPGVLVSVWEILLQEKNPKDSASIITLGGVVYGVGELNVKNRKSKNTEVF